jgi:hypothetical protein
VFAAVASEHVGDAETAASAQISNDSTKHAANTSGHSTCINRSRDGPFLYSAHVYSTYNFEQAALTPA